MNSYQTDPVCEFSVGSKNELMAVCEMIELRTLGITSLVLNTLLLCDKWMFSWLRTRFYPSCIRNAHLYLQLSEVTCTLCRDSKIHLSIQTLLCKCSVTHNSSLGSGCVSSRSFSHTFTHLEHRIVPAEAKAKFRWH